MEGFLISNIKSIILIQSVFRRFKATRIVQTLRLKTENNKRMTRQLVRDELFETLSSSKRCLYSNFGLEPYNPSEKRVNKQEYRYKTGGRYTGQWKGGFRDGKGRMTWLDGSSYDGEWQLGYAHGKGKFRDG